MMKKVITRMLAFAAVLLCGGAWAMDVSWSGDMNTTKIDGMFAAEVARFDDLYARMPDVGGDCSLIIKAHMGNWINLDSTASIVTDKTSDSVTVSFQVVDGTNLKLIRVKFTKATDGGISAERYARDYIDGNYMMAFYTETATSNDLSSGNFHSNLSGASGVTDSAYNITKIEIFDGESDVVVKNVTTDTDWNSLFSDAGTLTDKHVTVDVKEGVTLTMPDAVTITNYKTLNIIGKGTVMYPLKKVPQQELRSYRNSSWEGIVYLRNCGNSNDSTNHKYLPLNLYGNKNSTLKLTGFSGYTIVNRTFPGTLELEDGDGANGVTAGTAAADFNNGNGGTYFKFAKLIGDGTLKQSKGGTCTQNYMFGDVSGFTGSVDMFGTCPINFVFGNRTQDTSHQKQLHIASGAYAKIAAGMKWSANGGVIVDGELDLTEIADGASATTGVACNLTIGANARLRVPATVTEGAVYTLCTGTLTVTSAATQNVCLYVGSTPKIVNLTYNTEAKTVEWTEVTGTVACDVEHDFANSAIEGTKIYPVGSKTVTLKNINSADLAKIDQSFFTGELEFVYELAADKANDTTLSSYIKTAPKNTKFIFIGGIANNTPYGATVDLGTGGKTLHTHLVFRGGKHNFKFSNGNQMMGADATNQNPTILVDGNGTLNFYGHDVTGWNVATDVNGVIGVKKGSTLNFFKYGAGTVYYSQRLWIEPGATVNISDTSAPTEDQIGDHDFRMTGGATQAKAQIFVPDSVDDKTATPAIINANTASGICLAKDYSNNNTANRGLAIYVGENAKLLINGKIKSLNDDHNVDDNAKKPLAKYGKGILAITEEVVAEIAVNNGTFEFANATELTCNSPISGSGDIVKSKAGKLVLSNVSSYTGMVTLDGGSLAVSNAFESSKVAGATAKIVGETTTYYKTIASAVADATTEQEIEILADSSESLALSSDVIFTVAHGKEYTLSGTVTTSHNFTKKGTGTLKATSSSNNFTGVLTVSSGTFVCNTKDRGLAGTQYIESGATLKSTRTSDSLHYDQTTATHVKGTLDLTNARWSLRADNKIYLYPGSSIVGANTDGTLDNIAPDQTSIFAVKNNGVGGDVTIDTEIRFRGTGINPVIDIEEGMTVKYTNSVGFRVNSSTLKLTGSGVFDISAGASLNNLAALNVGSGVALISAKTISCAVNLASGAAIDATAGALTASGAVTFSGSARVKLAEGATIAGASVLTLSDSGTCDVETSPIMVEVYVGGVLDTTNFYKLVKDGNTIKVAVSDPMTREETISNNLSLGDISAAGGTLKLLGSGGVQGTSLTIPANCTLELDPIKTPIYLKGGVPSFATGAKIKLASAYDSNTKGVFTLMSWDGETQIDAATYPTMVDKDGNTRSGSFSQVTYTTKLQSNGSGGGVIATVEKTITVLKFDLDPEGEKKTITIMPLGDSITEGSNQVGFGNPNYRMYLFDILASKGYNVKSTGFRPVKTMNAAGAAMPEDWCWHNGVSGQRLISNTSTRAGWQQSIEPVLEASDIPDIVTFKIGTNDAGTDINTMFTAWTNTMWRILDARPSTKIVVGTIMDHNTNKTWSDNWNNALRAAIGFDEETQTWRNTPGFPENRVYFADLNLANPRRDSNNNYLGTFLSESDLHPNWIGHEKNAQCWAEAVARALETDLSATYVPNTKTGARNNVGGAYLADFKHLKTFKPNNQIVNADSTYIDGNDIAEITEETKFRKVGYYMELKNHLGNVRWVWVDMDAWEDVKTIDHIGIPTDDASRYHHVVTSLHVDSNDLGITKIAPTDNTKTGIVKFTNKSSGYSASSTIDGVGKAYGYDGADAINADADYGLMQIYRVAPPTTKTMQTLMAFNHWKVAGQQEIGIGDFAFHCTPDVANNSSKATMNYMYTHEFGNLNLAHYLAQDEAVVSIEFWGAIDDGIVARIGDVEYSTLAEAIADVEDEQEIVISDKVSAIEESIELTKNVTIVCNNDVTIVGVVSGTGALVKKGAGALTLGGTGDNTFSGGLTVAEGVVIAGKGNAFKSGGSVTVLDGATVDLNGKTGLYNFTIAGAGAEGMNGAITNSSSGIGSFTTAGAQSLTLSADATIGGNYWWGMQQNTTGSLDVDAYTLTIKSTDVANANLGFEVAAGTIQGTGKIVIASGARIWQYAGETIFGGTLEIESGAKLYAQSVGQVFTAANLVLDGTVDANGILKTAGNVSGAASLAKLTLASGATISGQIAVTGTISVDDTVTLAAADATLAVPAEIDSDKIKSAVANTTVAYDPATKTYSVHVPDSHTFTPTASGDFSWANGVQIGEKIYHNTDNMTFATTEHTTTVSVPSKVTSGTLNVGGIYTFSGSPIVATALSTIAGANATFANDVVADTITVNNGIVKGESFVTSNLSVENATFGAKVVGPSMRYVRLTVTAIQGGSGNQPAVGEFRLYRGNATTGYTTLDWPVGTKVRESTGLVATKDTEGYPAEVGAGLGSRDGNECQPGCLIDGYYGNKNSPATYGGGSYKTPAYNKWWPNSQATGPWVVTFEFPYPVAMFSGCNFCLADHGPRNPTAWTIEVSNDGTNWTTVNNTTSATWSGQYAWAGGNENVPAFLNTGTTPTTVSVGDGATVLADGNWTAALNVSGNVTLKGVAAKHLTLDAASTSTFAAGAALTFDLSDYSVTKAGNQYVVAGPLEGWPDTDAITVVPEGLFTVGKDEFGYYATARNGTYWLGDEDGVGTWNVANAAIWAESAESDTGLIWLNGAAANFSRNGDVTVADGVEATGITLTENVEVSLTGTLPTIGASGITIAANSTLTIGELTDAATTLSAVVSGAGSIVFDIGADKVLTLSGNNANLTGNVTVKSGTVKLGSSNCLGQKNVSTRTILVKSGAILDMGGQGSSSDPAYTLTLEEGAKYTSSVAAGGDSKWAFLPSGLVLLGDATIEAGDYRVGLSRGYNYTTTVDLGSHTLTKTGAGEAYFSRPTILGAGKFLIAEGSVRMACDTYNSNPTLNDGTLEIRSGAELVFDNYQNGANFSVKNAIVNGSVNGYGRLTVNSALSGSGTIEKLTLANGVTVSGSITVTTEAAVSNGGSVTLTGSETTLTIPSAFASGKVVSGVDGMSVKKTVGESAVVYSLVNTAENPIVPSDDPNAPAVVIDDIGTSDLVVAPGAKVVVPTTADASQIIVKYEETTLTDGEHPLVTVSVNQETGAVELTTTDAAKPAATAIAMATPTEGEGESATDKVQFTITNPIPGLFYEIVSGDSFDSNGDLVVDGNAEKGTSQATSATSKTVSIPMTFTDGKKVKYYKVSVKATK